MTYYDISEETARRVLTLEHKLEPAAPDTQNEPDGEPNGKDEPLHIPEGQQSFPFL